ncbi:MAG TPA: hypothetical protein PLF25_08780, partial [Accumulibacter sp.]|nr:hypothetical protein [Accumulibacter sp.]
MSEKPDLIERANLLIKAESGVLIQANPEALRQLRRRRSFIASDRATLAGQIRARLTSSQADDDDLPVLTEEVAAEDVDSATPGSDLSPPLASELAGMVEQRLAELLPGLVQTVLANSSRQLQQAIEAGV